MNQQQKEKEEEYEQKLDKLEEERTIEKKQLEAKLFECINELKSDTDNTIKKMNQQQKDMEDEYKRKIDKLKEEQTIEKKQLEAKFQKLLKNMNGIITDQNETIFKLVNEYDKIQ